MITKHLIRFTRSMATFTFAILFALMPYGFVAVEEIDFSSFIEKQIVHAMPTGPANVNTNIALWLRADAGLVGGSTVSDWQDQSGNGNNFDDGAAGEEANGVSETINFNPTLAYIGGDETEFDNSLGLSGTGDQHYFFVTKPNIFSGRQTIAEMGTPLGGRQFLYNGSNLGVDRRGGFSSGDIGGGSIQGPNIAQAGVPNLGAYSRVSGQGTMSINGLGGTVEIDNYSPLDNGTVIGERKNGNNSETFNGSVSEMIIYDGQISETQSDSISSYLALKYGITLESDVFAENLSLGSVNQGTNSTHVGQTFTATKSGQINQFSFLKNNSPANPATINVYLCDGNELSTNCANSPDRTATNVPFAGVTDFVANFDNALPVVAGQVYTVVIEINGNQTGYPINNNYSGGVVRFDNSTTVRQDMVFQVAYVNPYLAADASEMYNDPVYGKNVVGIAKDEALDQRVSRSQTGVVILTTDDATADFTSANGGTRTQLTENQYLILGSNTGALTSATTTITGYSNKIARQWRAENTGSVGNVNIKFDIPAITGTDWGLVQSDTADFADAGANLTKVVDLDTNGEATGAVFVDGKYYGVMEVNTAVPELTYGAVETFDVSTAVYAGPTEDFSVNAQEAIARGLAFSADGSKLFIVGSVGDAVVEYTLGNNFDVSTAVYTGASEEFSVAAQEVNPSDLAFNPDGSKMYILGYGSRAVNEYNLGTNFDVSTAVYAGVSEQFSVAGEELSPQGMAFSTDGSKMFIAGVVGDAVVEYNLGTNFDVSTAVYAGGGEEFFVRNEELSVGGVAFNTDGSKMFITGGNGNSIVEYNLGVNFDISTAVYAGASEEFSVAAQETATDGLAFSPDGSKLFIIGGSDDVVTEYALGTPNSFTETSANNGAVDGQLAFTLSDDTFEHTAGQTTLTEGTDFSIPNKPAGLTAVLNLKLADGTTDPTNANTATVGIITFTGSATIHENAQDIAGLTIQFTDSAFTNTAAAGVNNSGAGTAFNTGAPVDFNDAPDSTAPTLTQVTSVPTPAADQTPDYTFSSDEAGVITYGGSCSSATTAVTVGNNTITLNTLPSGTYNDCTITVTDIAGNPSLTLNITAFIIDTALTDTDGDGVTDIQEDATPNAGDANGDGTDDKDQSFVSSTPNPSAGPGAYTTLQTDNAGCSFIRRNQYVAAPTDPGFTYPLGLLDFQVECVNPGDSTQLTIIYDKEYPEAQTDWVYRKQDGATLRTLTSVTFGTITVGGVTKTTAVFTATDGDANTDDDSIARFITDPSGPGVPVVNNNNSGSRKGGSRVFACKDATASNYSDSRFRLHKSSLCEYETEKIAVASTTSNPFGGEQCSTEQVVSNNMKNGDRNGKYSSYNQGAVTEVKILQGHMNRLLLDEYGNQASGPVDGIFGPLTKRGVERLQMRLNELLPDMTPLVIDGIVGPFTKVAINMSC